MKKICVITGGGSGMGFAAAKIIGKEHKVILTGRTVKKLDSAIDELKSLGIEAVAFACDVSNRESVKDLVAFATEQGVVKSVIHSAGISTTMGSASQIFSINAIGTINVNEEFGKVMGEGSSIINVSSMAAYLMPADRMPVNEYPLSLSDAEGFNQRMLGIFSSLPAESAGGASYCISKNFVVWYSVQSACLLGAKGIRVLSVSPGTFKTPMGEAEGENAIATALRGVLSRVGEVDEVAKLLAFVASDVGSYMTGTDILCDGGVIAAMRKVQ